MKILLAPDSFKGSLSAREITTIIRDRASAYLPDTEFVEVPMADGGEGTLETIHDAGGGDFVQLMVTGPMSMPVKAKYLVRQDGKCFIEMAEASGMIKVKGRSNPMFTTSFGTGELIRHAISQGYRDITISLGGSATNDAGLGALNALGVRYLDEKGHEVPAIGSNLEKIARIDAQKMMSEVRECRITLLYDVINPFTGPEGAARVFGPQKGASPEQIEHLERGMEHIRSLLYNLLGLDLNTVEGSGAAGGMAGLFHIYLGGHMVKGVDYLMNMVNYDRLMQGVNLVVTGEGRVDGQSAMGKVLTGVCEAASKAYVPVIALTGSIGMEAERVYEQGISTIFTIEDGPMTEEEAIIHARYLIESAVDRMFRLLLIGMSLGDNY